MRNHPHIPNNPAETAVAQLAESGRPLVFAVSGGLDSMAMLNAAARIDLRVHLVAHFDHLTGPHSARASELVRWSAERLGFRMEIGQAPHSVAARTEAEWRAQRWTFLRDAARRIAPHGQALIVTGHTRDDQVETVAMRVLRGAGARGLAALYADSADVARPLLSVTRSMLYDYVHTHGIEHVEDPSNESRAHLRNRVRHDILPALTKARPQLVGDLLELSRRAAVWRRTMEEIGELVAGPGLARDGSLVVASDALSGYDSASLTVLWPVLAARVGLALDRRGTSRLAEFTITAGTGRSMQVSGGWEVIRRRDAFVLRKAARSGHLSEELQLDGASMLWGSWGFERAHAQLPHDAADVWTAELPMDTALSVRAWRDGDRIVGSNGEPRRVKRFFADAGISDAERKGWPVVVAGEDVVWIPGVRRSRAATARSGRPGVWYRCERYGTGS